MLPAGAMLATALVAGVAVVAGAGGVICGGCPCVLSGVLAGVLWAGA